LPGADYVPPVYTVFNIAHTACRLIAMVDYRLHTVWVHRVFTHGEYDRWKP